MASTAFDIRRSRARNNMLDDADLMYHESAKSMRASAVPAAENDMVDSEFKMTSYDRFDMNRMGKKQEMRRVFRQFSILSFTCVIMATWEFLLTANTQGLVDGGLAGLFWSYVWTICGFGLIIASMAECASMAPTSGMFNSSRYLAPSTDGCIQEGNTTG